MRMFNAQTGSYDDIPDGDVGNAFLKGTHGFDKGQPVYLMDPNGQINLYDSQDVSRAVNQGNYSFPSADAIKEHQMQEKYGDRAGTSYAMGLLDTLSFGGASQAAKLTGLASPEALKEIPERNALSHAAGSATAIVGSVLFSPEAIALKGAKEAAQLAEASGDAAQIAAASNNLRNAKNTLSAIAQANPINAVSNIASKASSILAVPEEASTLSKMAYGFGKGAIQGGIEGAAFTAGELNREAAIGDPELTPGAIASKIGFGALIGGTLGGFFGAGGEAASVLKQKLAPEGIFAKLTEAHGSVAHALEKYGDKLHFIPGINSITEGVEHVVSPLETLEKYGKLEHEILGTESILKIKEMVEDTGRKVATKIRSALAPSEEMARSAIGPISASLATREEKHESHQKNLDEYRTITGNLQMLNNNFAQMTETLHNSTKYFGQYAPDTSAQIQNTIMAGVQFLNSKIPQKQTDDIDFEPFVPSKQQMAQFKTYYDTVENPLTVLDSLKNNSVSLAQVETLKSVYPSLYDAMRLQVYQQAVNQKQKLSFQKKVALGLFLGQDVNSSFKPKMIAANQISFAKVRGGQSAKANGMIKPTAKAMGNLNIAGLYTTPLEKASQRAESREA